MIEVTETEPRVFRINEPKYVIYKNLQIYSDFHSTKHLGKYQVNKKTQKRTDTII